MGCSHCLVDSVIDGSMVMVSAFVPSAAEAMGGSAVNLHPTVVTGVWLAQG